MQSGPTIVWQAASETTSLLPRRHTLPLSGKAFYRVCAVPNN
jgi:hypothetical protein